MNTRSKRGKMIKLGKIYKEDSKKELISDYFKLLLGIGIITFFTYFASIGNIRWFGSTLLPYLVLVTVNGMAWYVFLFYPGAGLDVIYEKGITYSKVSLIEKLRGKGWIPWDEVKKVYYGVYDFEDKRGKSEYVQVVGEKNMTQPIVKKLYEKYSPEFYPLLVKLLKEKCPNAKWIKKDI